MRVGGVLPDSLVGRARGFLLPPFAGACIVSEEGSRVRVLVVVLDVQVLVEVTNPNPTPTLSFVFCL